jgi:hypothetical protein
MIKCQCPHPSEYHPPNECQNGAFYIVSRVPHDSEGNPCGEAVDVKVCPECKFPDDFNVRLITRE